MTEPSAQDILSAVLIAQDRIVAVEGKALHPEDVRQAVAQGIKDAVSDPQLWAAAVVAMQSHAQNQAGGWLLGVLKATFSKLLLFFAVGLAVYSIGGWSALASLFKTSPPP